jgi:hypothetical protein
MGPFLFESDLNFETLSAVDRAMAATRAQRRGDAGRFARSEEIGGK